MGLTDLLNVYAESKALPNVPYLRGDVPTSTYQPGLPPGPQTASKITQRESRKHLQVYGGDQAIDWIMDSISLIMETASSAAWHFERDGAKLLRHKDAAQPSGKLAPEALVRLFEEPNPFMDYAELVELTIIDYLLVGNGYWLKWKTNSSKQPLALYRLAPPYVKGVAGPYGLESFEYQLPGQRDPLVLAASDVVHFKRPNPHSAYFGLGIVKGGGRALDAELAITDTKASYFENHADPSLIVQSERRVPRDVFNKLRSQLRARSSGSGRAGDLMVLEAGLKATTVSSNAQQAAFGDLTRLSRDRVFAMFKTSPKLFGIGDEKTSTDKISDAQRIFDTKMMRPLLDKFQTRVSKAITQPCWGLDYVVDYEYVMPIEDRWKLIATIGAIPGITVDELRERAGLPPHTDKTIGDMTLNLPGENAGTGQPGDPTRQGFPDRSLPTEPGRPPKSDNTKAFPVKGGKLPAGAAVRASNKKSSGKALDPSQTLDSILARLQSLSEASEGKASERVIHSTLDENRPPDLLIDSRTPDIDYIVSDLQADLAAAAHTLERNLLDHIDGKALGAGLRRRVERSRAWTTFTQTITAAIEGAVKRALSTAAVHQGSIGNTPSDELDYDGLTKSVVYRSGGVRAIAATLRKSITAKLAGLNDNADIEAVIREQIEQWKTGQAETVALTEATHGYNEGTLAVAESAGSTHVLVSDGHDHDEPCQVADGQIWTIEEARANRLEHPRCRRAFVPVTNV